MTQEKGDTGIPGVRRPRQSSLLDKLQVKKGKGRKERREKVAAKGIYQSSITDSHGKRSRQACACKLSSDSHI